ncbi:hypothetical protein [Pseudomonas veronii]
MLKITNINTMSKKTPVSKDVKNNKSAVVKTVAKSRKSPDGRVIYPPLIIPEVPEFVNFEEDDKLENLDLNDLKIDSDDEFYFGPVSDTSSIEVLKEDDIDFSDWNFDATDNEHVEATLSERQKKWKEYAEERIEETRQHLVEMLDNIEYKISVNDDAQGIDVSDDLRSGYSTSLNLAGRFRFYLPKHIFDLLDKHGLSHRASELKLSPPSGLTKENKIRFEKTLILHRDTAEFIYSCSFRRALKNAFECMPRYSRLYYTLIDFVEAVHNLDDADSDSCRCESEYLIRNSKSVIIDLVEYLNISNRLYKDFEPKSVRYFWNR